MYSLCTLYLPFITVEIQPKFGCKHRPRKSSSAGDDVGIGGWQEWFGRGMMSGSESGESGLGGE